MKKFVDFGIVWHFNSHSISSVGRASQNAVPDSVCNDSDDTDFDKEDSSHASFLDCVEVLNLADTVPFVDDDNDDFKAVEEMEEHMF
eukprot:6765537-Ditylum_brightwellii.AAC.1